MPPEQPDALLEVRRSVRVPIAAGERLITRWDFRRVCELQACHVLQPDLSHCGGLLEARKIASMGETYLMGVAPHNPNGPVCTAAAIQIAASIPNFVIMEEGNTNPKEYDQIFTGGWKPNLAEWTVPEGPGLGVDLSPEFLKDHVVKV